jgi:hypothetical protein
VPGFSIGGVKPWFIGVGNVGAYIPDSTDPPNRLV